MSPPFTLYSTIGVLPASLIVAPYVYWPSSTDVCAIFPPYCHGPCGAGAVHFEISVLSSGSSSSPSFPTARYPVPPPGAGTMFNASQGAVTPLGSGGASVNWRNAASLTSADQFSASVSELLPLKNSHDGPLVRDPTGTRATRRFRSGPLAYTWTVEPPEKADAPLSFPSSGVT